MPLANDLAPGWLIAIIDMLFLIMLAMSIAAPILKIKQKTNYVFPIIAMAMFIANGLCHLEFLGLTETTAMIGLNLMMYLIVILIMVMGGRVIPFFTERGVPGVTTQHWKLIQLFRLALFCFQCYWWRYVPMRFDFMVGMTVAFGVNLWCGYYNWVMRGWCWVCF